MKKPLSEKAAEARREYNRRYYAKHREKRLAAQYAYWERKVVANVSTNAAEDTEEVKP